MRLQRLMKQWLRGGKVSSREVQKLHLIIYLFSLFVFQGAFKHENITWLLNKMSL